MSPTDAAEASWRVRVLRTGGTVAGAGVLVTDRTVLTCGHVVSALKAPLTVDIGAEQRKASIEPDHWHLVADVALLTLRGPVTARPAKLKIHKPQTTIQVYGYPPRLDAGLWRSATIAGPGGPGDGWVQLDTPGEPPLSQGFSGAGVMAGDGAVVGIVVARFRADGLTANWMIPIEVCARYVPLAFDTAHPRSLFQLAWLLADVPVMKSADTRQQVIDSLRPEISGAVARSTTPIHDMVSLLRTCQAYERGIDELLDVLRGLDRGSIALAKFEEALDR